MISFPEVESHFNHLVHNFQTLTSSSIFYHEVSPSLMYVIPFPGKFYHWTLVCFCSLRTSWILIQRICNILWISLRFRSTSSLLTVYDRKTWSCRISIELLSHDLLNLESLLSYLTIKDNRNSKSLTRRNNRILFNVTQRSWGPVGLKTGYK